MLALDGEFRAVIERRIRARRLDCPHIFHRNGKPLGEFRKTWLSACKAAGLAVTEQRDGKEITRAQRLVYDLRRTAIRNMARAGVDPTVVMKISGHRTRNVFDRYNITDDVDVRDASVKTTAYVSSLPTTSTVVPFRAVEGNGATRS